MPSHLALVLLAIACLDAAETAPTAPIPVAGWDVVPYQVIDQPLHVGVVAFHRSALHVAFTVSLPNVAAPVLQRTVTAPTLNTHTGVWEYWCSVDPAAMPDGPFQVAATVSVADEPAVVLTLDPLPLYANTTHTLPLGREVVVDATAGDDTASGDAEHPLRTLKAGIAAAKDGGCVRLRAGSYAAQQLGAGMKRSYWTTITTAAGVPREAVEITPGRPGSDKLRFAGVTISTNPTKAAYNAIFSGEQDRSILWVDDCIIVCKSGREMSAVLNNNRYPTYVTGGETVDLSNGPAAVLMRGHRIRRICADAFTNVRIAINCTVDEIDRGATEAHPDFCQSHISKPDDYNSFILYNCRGLRCGAQGFFGLNVRNSAFVNCLFVKYPDDSPLQSQYNGYLENVLFLHLTLPNQTWLWRGAKTLGTRDVWFANSIVAAMHGDDPTWTAGLRLDNTHVIKNLKTRITNASSSTGPAGFADPTTGDYRLRPDSPAVGNALPLPCVPADIDGTPWPASGPNRGCLRTVSP